MRVEVCFFYVTTTSHVAQSVAHICDSNLPELEANERLLGESRVGSSPEVM